VSGVAPRTALDTTKINHGSFRLICAPARLVMIRPFAV